MSFVLSSSPAWLESPLANPGSVIVLMNGDGYQARVPAVILLSYSHFVRNLLADHLPPTYSPPAISLPAVSRKTLQLVELLCSGGELFVGGDSKDKVEDVLKMLNPSELESDCVEGPPMKVKNKIECVGVPPIKVKKEIDCVEGQPMKVKNEIDSALERVMKMAKEQVLDVKVGMQNIVKAPLKNKVDEREEKAKKFSDLELNSHIKYKVGDDVRVLISQTGKSKHISQYSEYREELKTKEPLKTVCNYHEYGKQLVTKQTRKKAKSSPFNSIKVGKRSKRMRCGDCVGCKSSNCGKCMNCKDMRCFGGKGTRAQACVERKCLMMTRQRRSDKEKNNNDRKTKPGKGRDGENPESFMKVKLEESAVEGLFI